MLPLKEWCLLSETGKKIMLSFNIGFVSICIDNHVNRFIPLFIVHLKCALCLSELITPQVAQRSQTVTPVNVFWHCLLCKSISVHKCTMYSMSALDQIKRHTTLLLV